MKHTAVAYCLCLSMMLAALWPSAADARSLSIADPEEVMNLARGYGSAVLKKDSQGDPMISCKADGLGYSIYFYNCKDGKDCTSIQWHSGFELKSPVKYGTINDWNSKKRFSRAVRDSDGDALIRMDMLFTGGTTSDNVDRNMDLWISLLKEFAAHIGYRN
ncbi:MAG: YbjN domain-containing protein [Hyphomicrobiaceae bacterium]